MLLSNFLTHPSQFESTQEQITQWLAHAHTQAEKIANHTTFDADLYSKKMGKIISKYGGGSDKIGKRGHELEDFTHYDWHKMSIFNLNHATSGRGMLARNQFFLEITNKIFETLYPPDCSPPHDLIHVTCTGYVSPSAAQRLINTRGWNRTTRATHLYHMGCYAAFPALRVAQGFIAAAPGSSTRVDIVHTELCSLHLNPSLHSSEQLVIQNLFADGSIRYTATPRISDKPGLELIALHEETVPNSTEAMQWVCADWGMQMVLSREVSVLIADSIKPFLNELYKQAHFEYSKNCGKTVFAIHPGGPKIIETVQALLELDEVQIKHSKKILFNHGNMSSSTLPYIWQDIVQDAEVSVDTPVVSLAFGPGLTISGGLFRKV